ncbi:MAG TPA: dihydroneopterin aldolase [Acetivibrio sp.]|uniref:dihydroneopterin aldolase n=1 Tax=Acetivibrio sp. TaxID=1872092 RepID=UPI002C933CA6|nr:dihydroneopterin aldolase [Acetivibrio sp.]HOM01879.1 dihydroneopterin aldolase [Acetivibrio sp.]
MDKIILKDMKFYGYHGVFPEEREKGQNFYIDVEAFLDLKKAGETDDLEETVDYSKIYDIIKNINENNKFRLIERFAHIISREILSTFRQIDWVVVRVRKPDAPIEGEFEWVGVEIERFSNEI